MDTVQKLGLGIIGIGMLTTALLPGRQTVGVLNAIKGLFQGSLYTSITGKK